jgi:hypothetical protein
VELVDRNTASELGSVVSIHWFIITLERHSGSGGGYTAHVGREAPVPAGAREDTQLGVGREAYLCMFDS